MSTSSTTSTTTATMATATTTATTTTTTKLATNLMISASFAASGAYAQVSRDISAQLEEAARKPPSYLALALLEADADAIPINDDSCSVDTTTSSSNLVFEPRLELEDDRLPFEDPHGLMMMLGEHYNSNDDDDDLFAPRLEAASPDSAYSKKQGKAHQRRQGMSPAEGGTLSSSASSSTIFLTKCFSNIQLVSPKFFHQRQETATTPKDSNNDSASLSTDEGHYHTPKENLSPISDGSHNSFYSPLSSSPPPSWSSSASHKSTKSTVSGKRNTLASMVHSLDLALFPNLSAKEENQTNKTSSVSTPTSQTQLPPVIAKLGRIITGKAAKGGYREQLSGDDASSIGSNGDGEKNMSGSFYSCRMNEDSMSGGGSPPGINSSSKKRKKSPETAPTTTNTSPSPIASSASPELAPLFASLAKDTCPSTPTRSRTASSFQSSRHYHRITYPLRAGRRGMSPRSKESYVSFLPRFFHLGQKKLNAIVEPTPQERAKQRRAFKSSPFAVSTPSPTPKKNNITSISSSSDHPDKKNALPNKLYVLLLEIPNKLFEICPVDYVNRDMTVGDVLAKVRTQASDTVLAAQSYKSLINENGLEISAPMLPVSLLLETHEMGTKPLLTALPPNASASQCRHIQNIIMNHPTMQRFWQRDDPFEPSPPKKQRQN